MELARGMVVAFLLRVTAAREQKAGHIVGMLGGSKQVVCIRRRVSALGLIAAALALRRMRSPAAAYVQMARHVAAELTKCNDNGGSVTRRSMLRALAGAVKQAEKFSRRSAKTGPAAAEIRGQSVREMVTNRIKCLTHLYYIEEIN